MKATLKLGQETVVTLEIPGKTPGEVRAADAAGKAEWDGNEDLIAQAKRLAHSCYAPVAPSLSGLGALCESMHARGVKGVKLTDEGLTVDHAASVHGAVL